MIRLKDLCILESKDALASIPQGKKLINTVNAHSFNTAKKDKLFAEALIKGDYLIPDGASIVKACHWLKAKSRPKERIAGWDLFVLEMGRLNDNHNENDNQNENGNENGNENHNHNENGNENDNQNENYNENGNEIDNEPTNVKSPLIRGGYNAGLLPCKEEEDN